MRERLYTEIALEALNMAIERQRPAPGLIHHSDSKSVPASCSWAA
jgi:putative transposase